MFEVLCLATSQPHDGDTFRLCDGTKVRLVAQAGPVDAPDYISSPRCRPVRRGWCDVVLALRSRDRFRALLRQADALHCAGSDGYGRRLCRVTIGGRDVGDMLVREGLAVIMKDWDVRRR